MLVFCLIKMTCHYYLLIGIEFFKIQNKKGNYEIVFIFIDNFIY